MKWLSFFIVFLASSFIGCSEDSKPTSGGTSSAEAISSASSSSSEITCELAKALPEWNGSSNMDWEDNVGNTCYAAINASKEDIETYEDSLGRSRWASAQGWITSGTTSAITYVKKKNSDTLYTLSISCDTTKSRFAFSMGSASIVYKSNLEQLVGSLPEWNGTEPIAWTVDSESGASNQIKTTQEEEDNYDELLLDDGWVSEESPFINQRWFTKTYKEVEYLLSFTIVQGGLVEIGVEEY